MLLYNGPGLPILKILMLDAGLGGPAAELCWCIGAGEILQCTAVDHVASVHHLKFKLVTLRITNLRT